MGLYQRRHDVCGGGGWPRKGLANSWGGRQIRGQPVRCTPSDALETRQVHLRSRRSRLRGSDQERGARDGHVREGGRHGGDP